MIILDKQVRIFMMDKDNKGNDLSALNSKAKKQLTKVFGGLTITKAAGTWIDAGKLYEDSSYIFSCSYSGKLTDEQASAVIEVVKAELNKGKQQAVSIMFYNKLLIVTKEDLKQLEKMLKNN